MAVILFHKFLTSFRFYRLFWFSITFSNVFVFVIYQNNRMTKLFLWRKKGMKAHFKFPFCLWNSLIINQCLYLMQNYIENAQEMNMVRGRIWIWRDTLIDAAAIFNAHQWLFFHLKFKILFDSFSHCHHQHYSH